MPSYTEIRYKVISDYPDSPFKVGDILTHVLGFTYSINGSHVVKNVPNIDKYDNIFSLIPWWDGLSESDLPKYVKTIPAVTPKAKQGVYRVHNWSIPYGVNVGSDGLEMNLILPATEQEYKAFTKN